MLPEADDAGIDPARAARVAAIMSQVDSTDFEPVDPPDGLWARIAASIVAEQGSAPTGSGTVVEYSIDSDDIVIAINEDWSTFARQNDAPELAEMAADRTLWSYFDSDEVRDLWRLLIERVRAAQVQAHVPFRCDAPRHASVVRDDDHAGTRQRGALPFRPRLRRAPTRRRVPERARRT